MNSLIITLDIDWACEPAIEETLSFLRDKKITPTIFSTHRSKVIEENMNYMEVGLHPFFGINSSHGSSINEVAKHVIDLPHNFPAFRCHQFGVCNSSKKAMVDCGMKLSSNVCTDLEIVPPFIDRFGLIEVPIFLEDGGYLLREHSLIIEQKLKQKIMSGGDKVIIVHPMHFALNTPNFSYMFDVKKSLNRYQWQNMPKRKLDSLRWKGRGIRNFINDLIEIAPCTKSLSNLLAS